MPAEKFLKYLEYEKRYSIHTLTAYRTDLEQFFIYLNAQFQTNDLKQINHFYIRSWIVSLIEAKLNTRSVNRKITVLKSFFKFLMREKIVELNPMIKIQSPKNSKRLPVFVDKIKMQEVLDPGGFENNFIGLRNKLVIELFYNTGIRLSELVNITTENINAAAQTIKVLGKRNKERLVPIATPLATLIEQYLKERKKVLEQKDIISTLVFVKENGTAVNQKTIYHVVRKHLGENTTLQKKSPHVLRHTFATHMLDNGADINAVKEILGHSSLAATQVYTHNTIEKLKNVHKQAHPRS